MSDLDPIAMFSAWKQEAILGGEPDSDAMSVATVDADGMPHVRIVYLRTLLEEGFVFYTNYESNKGQQLLSHPKVALNFHWGSIDRQVRICGHAEKAPEELSDAYYADRARQSQLGAWASPQSREIPNREWLLKEVERVEQTFEGKEVQRPPFWGGFLVRPESMEFWMGRTARLHERTYYKRESGTWKQTLLAP